MSDREWQMGEEAQRIMRLPKEELMLSLRSASPQVRTEIALMCALHLNQRFPEMTALTDVLLDVALHGDDI